MFEYHVHQPSTLHIKVTPNVVHAQRAIVDCVIYILEYAQEKIEMRNVLRWSYVIIIQNHHNKGVNGKSQTIV